MLKVFCAFILGLLLTFDGGEGRAVNISNTWTLPQDGFEVFYRFFRDKISWFEADAVCQFHHANLVTVDNSVQFDASRSFLQILNVTQPVWIGLMRPQNSQLFSWTNSKPLASSLGYWAESIPLMESPLCAVIDPIRDYRWHALRCGGPETASFLCEMNAPNWARECIPRGLSSVTVQYMADSGTVEISKDCGNGITIQQICHRNQDLNDILRNLICENDSQHKFHDKENQLLETHIKSLELIKKVSSDNNEDNSINTQPQKTEEKKKMPSSTEKSLIHDFVDEHFSVDELMQADQPESHLSQTKITKLPKKSVKKAKLFEKKSNNLKKNRSKIMKNKEFVSLDEMMMGDQPAVDVEEVLEPLPHTKKSLPQDLKAHQTTVLPTQTTDTVDQTESSSRDISSPEMITEHLSTTTTTDKVITTSIVTSITTLPPPETKTGSIGHPMHPQQTPISGGAMPPMYHVHHEAGEMKHFIAKETNDNHFIPPMLLVKSHYTSTKSHLDEQNPSVGHTNDKIDIATATQNVADLSTATQHHVHAIEPLLTSSASSSTPASTSTHNTMPISDITTNHESTTVNPSTSFSPPAIPLISTTEHEVVEIKFQTSTNNDNNDEKNATTISVTIKPTVAITETLLQKINEKNSQKHENQPLTMIEEQQPQKRHTPNEFDQNEQNYTQKHQEPQQNQHEKEKSQNYQQQQQQDQQQQQQHQQQQQQDQQQEQQDQQQEQQNQQQHQHQNLHAVSTTTITTTTTTTTANKLSSKDNHNDYHYQQNSNNYQDNEYHNINNHNKEEEIIHDDNDEGKLLNSSKENHHPENEMKATKLKNKFSNEENYQPNKPNHRRILTKPTPHTYLHKILG